MAPRKSSTLLSATAPTKDVLGKRLSTATVLFHTAIADRMGIRVTDAKCRSLLLQWGPMPAGDLAKRLGLTTGAVTGVIDRLEDAGFVQRTEDPNDRRRVVVAPVQEPQRDRKISQLFAPMENRILALLSTHSAKEQAVIRDFLLHAAQILEEETARLRQRPPEKI